MTKAILMSQLKAIHNQNTWFVSLKSALHGLSEKEAEAKEKTNSIKELVNHLIFFNELELSKFKGKTYKQGLPDNSSVVRSQEQKSWIETITTFDAIIKEWERCIESADQQKLTDWSETISYLVLHNAYHIGQIVYIRKQTDTWKEQNGVDYNF